MKKNILWVDDEIELLRSHIILLTEKGFNVSTVTNGIDAIASIKSSKPDLMFLDEMMPGMGGLEVLSRVKEDFPDIPVVMVTKNEEEGIMNEAIGSKIADYLTKPVNPSQVFLVCKKILDSKKIESEYVQKDYLQDFNQINMLLTERLNHEDWIDIYTKLTNWEIELDKFSEIGLHQSLAEQKKECNKEFSRFIEKNFTKWVNTLSVSDRPLLTPDIIPEYVLKHVKESQAPVFLFVIDCLRLDQWLIMEKHLSQYFDIKKDYYYSILPTATSYARNSLFAGLFPSEIEKYYPDLWKGSDEDEKSMNKFEKDFLQLLLDRKRIKLRSDLKYIKIIDPEVGRNFEQNILSYKNSHFTAIVVNFLDMMVHGRSDSELLKEIAPDEPAYRSLTESWFIHSSLFATFKAISRIKGAKIVITTDHGSIRVQRGAKVLGDKETSSNLRFKYGRNLKVDEKNSIFIKDPAEYKLPRRGVTINYIIAKEDYYFVYPTDYHRYLSYYKDTFQHGGISMEEMLLPVISMDAK
ncbi:MAG: Chemotaxis response regulator protein-glutamate methylesterase [Ignavibacteriaceae bacterium]|nr:Chemotaxis response regulator protein-glutamate methylesterase [Ignavibacteriaceae bacterium]